MLRLSAGGIDAAPATAFAVPIESERRFYVLIEHDLRANALRFVARENRYTLFRIMLSLFVLTRFLDANRDPLRWKTLLIRQIPRTQTATMVPSTASPLMVQPVT